MGAKLPRNMQACIFRCFHEQNSVGLVASALGSKKINISVLTDILGFEYHS